ncbi:MAG: MerR family transcriptional regulator [Candidatus Cloacimonas sp.]|jgi:MerR family transcriptional regulator/heat shock protein HspR|nr:MerR family transcriptional regulator [Candidatus Cloacimonadota bacterium]
MKAKNSKDLIPIGQVAHRLGIHEQTIRAYERKGLVKPLRSEKRTRFFSEADVTRIMIITLLTQELGLNLAGVKILLDFAKQNQHSDDVLLDYIDDYKSEIIHKTLKE